MSRARCIALLALGHTAACTRAFVCKPHCVVSPSLSRGHVISHNHVRRRQRVAVGRAAARSSGPILASLDGVRSTGPEPECNSGAGPDWIWEAGLGPTLAVGALAAAAFAMPSAAMAAEPSALAAGLQMPLALNQLLAHPLESLAANPEWTRYAFMFPIGIFVATCAQTAGIGGAAIMGPFFLLGLPLLGPAYPLHSVAASVATAILSEAFGFSSGLFGYFRRGLIDAGSALPFILASLPACLLGAVIVPYADERVLKALYAVFMLGLSVYLLKDEEGSESLVPEECSLEELASGDIKAICSSDGKEYIYKRPLFGAGSGFSTAFGGLMTGMLGVGIGEVVIPQLVKKNGVPLPVAAGTSVLVVFLNAVVAAGTQISGIISRGAEEVPWNLIVFIVPGVIIGGQLAPRMQGRLSQRTMEKILAGVFGGVGATFATISVESLLAMNSASATIQ